MFKPFIFYTVDILQFYPHSNDAASTVITKELNDFVSNANNQCLVTNAKKTMEYYLVLNRFRL